MGQQVLTENLNNMHNEATVSTHVLKNGVYYYTVHVNNSKHRIR